jgi:aldose 1-epimerase
MRWKPGQLLIPWPNRIAGARYRFGGEDHRLPAHEPRTGSAIHGLVRERPWRVLDRSAAAVTLTLDLPPEDGHPFSLELRATYSVAGDGLTVDVTATNVGNMPCPYGAGAHPYLRLPEGGSIDDALLQIPADSTLEVDDRGIPTGAECEVEGTDLDFRSPRRIGSLKLDTAFTQLHACRDGAIRIALTSLDGMHGSPYGWVRHRTGTR